MQKHVGDVVDEDNFTHEVWLKTLPDGTKEHVYVMSGRLQIADFPYGDPLKNCDLSDAAHTIASGQETRVALPILLLSDDNK